MNSSPDNSPSNSPWLSDSADPKVVDLATQMFLEGQSESAIRHEIGRRGIAGDQQDAVVANIHRQVGKKRAAFDRQTSGAKARALASSGIGAIAILLGLGLLLVAKVLPIGIIAIGILLLIQGLMASRRADKRQFGPNT